ncbi:MAG: hypothetical protein KF708_18815 [Pirellulales bacterium]|nr:hypothetical protein [Pirellulales bacterium]
MRLRYFVVDRWGKLRRVSQAALEGLWTGERDTAALDCDLGRDLRLVTLLCDDELRPHACYLLRAALAAGQVTNESKLQACEAILENLADEPSRAEIAHQLAGWPRDWRRQLAVAADVVPSELPAVGIGGPLLISSLLDLSVKSSLRYFDQIASD